MVNEVDSIIRSINAVVVTPHGRSGSLFFQSLLDGHPEIIGFPGLELSYNFPDVIEDAKIELSRFIMVHRGLFDSSIGYLGAVGSAVTALLGANADEHVRIDADKYKK